MCRGAGDTDHRDAEEEGQRRHQHFAPGAEDGDQHQQRQDARQREERIDQTHRHLVAPSALEAEIDPQTPAP